MVDIAQAPKRKTASEVPAHLQSNASCGASLVLQRALTGALGPGDGGESEELLQRLVSANHSFQDANNEKTIAGFEGANQYHYDLLYAWDHQGSG